MNTFDTDNNPETNSMSVHADLLNSGFNQLLGFDIEKWETDFVQLGLTVDARLCNRSGTLHGGVLATLLDAAGGFSGCYCPREGHVRKAVTLSLNTSFTGQCSEGRIAVTGRRIGGGRKIFFITAEVRDEQENLLATAQGTYRYLRGSESEDGVPIQDA